MHALLHQRHDRQPQGRAVRAPIDDDPRADRGRACRVQPVAPRRRIAGGADFQAVAKESSEDTNSKGQGGDLGWFPADAFGPAFGQQVEGIQDGGVSQPFRTDAGWHIVQRVATRQTDVTSDNQRAQVRETIGRRKLEDEYNRFLQELRGEAYVSFRSGDRAENTATPQQP